MHTPSLRVLQLALLGGLALSSCSSSRSAAAGAERSSASAGGSSDVVLDVGGNAVSARFDGKNLEGPDLSVAVEDSAVRGEAFARSVDLSLAGNRVDGLVGSRQTTLEVQPQAQGFSARGSFGGNLTSFSLDASALRGNVGRCGYDLRRASAQAGSATGGSGGDASATYEGSRNCSGTGIASTRLTLPASFAQHSPAQQAAVLGLLLER